MRERWVKMLRLPLAVSPTRKIRRKLTNIREARLQESEVKSDSLATDDYPEKNLMGSGFQTADGLLWPMRFRITSKAASPMGRNISTGRLRAGAVGKKKAARTRPPFFGVM
jgi:hypothetical protein